MAKNCWKRCSPMGTGLGLALIVSISFLLGMIIVYLCSDTRLNTVFTATKYECSKACRCIEDFGSLVNDFHSPLGGALELRRSRADDYRRTKLASPKPFRSQIHETVCLGRNYPIAAVLKRTYLDDSDSFEYLTPAAILSPKWLLSSADFLNDTTTDVLYAAIGTKYWSKNGYLHHVDQKVSILDVLIALRLEVEIIIAVDFVRLIGGIQAKTISITRWNKEMKYKKATEKQLPVIDNSCSRNFTFCVETTDGAEDLRSTLAIFDNQLYGFYNNAECVNGKCVYRFNSIKPYIFYLYEVLYENKYDKYTSI